MTHNLHEAIEYLASFNDAPALGGVTREAFTPTYRRALDWVAEQMQDAGLAVRIDAFGNLIGRLEGWDPDAPAVLTGSHIDTTLNAGRYDGVVGVMGAICAVRALRSDGQARRPIEVIVFAGEEPRFGKGCIGSRAMVGQLTRTDLDTMCDRHGVTLAQALRQAGLSPDRLAEAQLDATTVHAFVELHIEQGTVLEHHGEAIGIVESIAAAHDFRLILRGAATHSGTTSMSVRRDALAGGAEAMIELERFANESPSGTTVATVGALRVAPGAINVVPGEVQLDVDVRDSSEDAREHVVESFIASALAIAERRRLELEVEPIAKDAPVLCSRVVVEAAVAGATSAGIAWRPMVSGAYHDAMVLGSIVPAGMIFVPSVGGVSHAPDELTAPADLERGVTVLAATLARLADNGTPEDPRISAPDSCSQRPPRSGSNLLAS
jgi:hydantoinase/carbamoylase family amidase